MSDDPFIASKNACSAHPSTALPGNAAYGLLIEFPQMLTLWIKQSSSEVDLSV